MSHDWVVKVVCQKRSLASTMQIAMPFVGSHQHSLSRHIVVKIVLSQYWSDPIVLSF